jgi:hypothetical protein
VTLALIISCWLQGVNASQSGPSLSLSSLGGQGHQPGTCGQPMLGQTYNAPAVPWLRNITSQGSDLGQVVGRPGVLNLQHLLSTDSKAGQSPHRSVTTAATNANSQVLRKGLHSLNPKPINLEVHSQSLEWSWSWIPYVYATLITIIHLYISLCILFTCACLLKMSQ